MNLKIKRLPANFIWPVLAFIIIFLLSLSVYLNLKEKSEVRIEKQFAALSSQAQSRLIRRLDQYLVILQGAKGLYSSTGSISRQQWKNYVTAFNINKNYPGIQGLAFVEIIKPEELTAHRRRLRRQGFPDYSIKPEGRRNLYTPVVYLEPLVGRNLAAIGFDMFSEPVRRQGMEKARDTGKPVLTGKIRLIQETTQNQQPGFILFLPIYQNSLLPANLEDRRRLAKGFIGAPFRAHDLMRNIFRNDFDDINIEIFDGRGINKENLLYNKSLLENVGLNNQEVKPEYAVLNYIQVGGRTWTMRITTKPEFSGNRGILPVFILIGGSLIALLAALVSWSLINQRRSDELKQIIMDNATGAVFMMDKNGYCTFMNPAAVNMTGYTFEEIRQKPLHEMIHHHRPDGSFYPIEECPLDKVVALKEKLRAHKDVFIRKDGTFFDVSCAVSPIYENGIPVASVIEVRDITEDQRAQVSLQESEARFRNMADSAPVIIWINNEQGLTTYLNRQWYEFTQLTEAESLNIGWQKSFHPEDLENVHAIYQESLKSKIGFTMDYRLRRFDGEYRWMAATANPRFDVKGEFRGYIGTIIDISERKEAEKRLKDNADFLHEIFLKVPAIVSIVRASDLVYILANPMFRSLHGNRPLIGRTIQEANPELEKQGFFIQIERVIATGKTFFKQEVPITIDNAGEPYSGYFNLVFQPLYNNKNQLVAVLLFSVEVTELVTSRKQLQETNEELNQTNEELRRTNTDLDNFVYTASHDLKAPIANLEGITSDLKYSLAGRIESDEQHLIELLGISINKLKRTITDLSDITKVQKQGDDPVEPLQIAELLQEVQTDIQNQILEAKAKFIVELEVQQLQYSRKNLRSILYNLLSNAIKYRSSDRKPLIKITSETAGDYIVLTISDNGLGIRQDQHHKLFGMFKRIHTHVEGSGIGLYIVKRIVENYGGHIEIESVVGQGSTFRIFFKAEAINIQKPKLTT